MKEGIILLGHGSRREEANEEIRQIARMVAEGDLEHFYETAFLSFGSPDLSEAVERLVQKGLQRIIIMPIFLVKGNHIQRDIPHQVSFQETAYPDIEFISTRYLGADPLIVDMVRERIAEKAVCKAGWKGDYGGNNLEV